MKHFPDPNLSRADDNEWALTIKTGLFIHKNMAKCRLSDIARSNGKGFELKTFYYDCAYYDIDKEALIAGLREWLRRLRIKPDEYEKTMNMFVSLDRAAFDLMYAGGITSGILHVEHNASVNCALCTYIQQEEPTYLPSPIGALRITDYKKRKGTGRQTAWLLKHEVTREELEIAHRTLEAYDSTKVWYYHYAMRWGCVHFHGVPKDKFAAIVVKECRQFIHSKGRTKAPWLFPHSNFKYISKAIQPLYAACFVRAVGELDVARIDNSVTTQVYITNMNKMLRGIKLPSEELILRTMQRKYVLDKARSPSKIFPEPILLAWYPFLAEPKPEKVKVNIEKKKKSKHEKRKYKKKHNNKKNKK
jgi:hypothetical protein